MLKILNMCVQAPLLIGCDVRNLTAETLEIISNEEVIAINQGHTTAFYYCYQVKCITLCMWCQWCLFCYIKWINLRCINQ